MADRDRALDLLLEITTLLADDMRRAFDRDGLTPARAHLLWVLHEQGPVPQRVLADELGVTPRTVTGLVDGLEESGHVVRRTYAGDRRVALVTLTQAGSRLAAEMAAGKAELAARLFGDLPRKQYDVLADGLADVRDRLAHLISADLAERGSGTP